MNNNERAGKFKFKVASFRKIPNPYFKQAMQGRTNPEMYILICDVLDVPDDIPMQTNPREQKLTTNVSKKIQASLTNHTDLNFYLLNRGILLSAESISFENSTDEVTITFDDLSVHGNVDGGHTYKIIKDNKALLERGEQYVKIEVLTGIEDMFEQLAAARNTSVQVKDKSIAELEKRFELIKNCFVGESFYDDINYKENDIKRIDVQDVLSILYLFNIDKYGTDSLTSFPISAYSSKKTCTDTYINASKTLEDKDNPYVKMRPIMVDIIKLYDKLEIGIGDYYKGDGTGIKKYGSVKGVSTHQQGKPPYVSKFYQNEMSYISPNGFILPILGSFRALVRENEQGEYAWIKNPFEVMDTVGSTLVNSTVDMSRQLGNNPNAVGKSQNLWMTLFMCVKMQTMLN